MALHEEAVDAYVASQQGHIHPVQLHVIRDGAQLAGQYASLGIGHTLLDKPNGLVDRQRLHLPTSASSRGIVPFLIQHIVKLGDVLGSEASFILWYLAFFHVRAVRAKSTLAQQPRAVAPPFN